MQNNFLFALITLILFPVAAAAQTADATALFDAINARVAAVDKGQFHISAAFKFADEEDTIRHEGRCYFFRTPVNAESMAQFVVISDGKPVYAFDGEMFYQVLENDKKIWVSNATTTKGGLRRLLGGNIRQSNLIYQNILRTGTAAFRTDAFDTVRISTLYMDDVPALRVTRRDTTIEEALGDIADNKIIADLSWDFSLPDLQLLQFTASVWLFDGWEYNHKLFSPIEPLPESAAFADYFDVDALATAYTFENLDYDAPVKREVELVKAGDRLPDFVLADLDGNAFELAKKKKGLLLLDFWYKGCFPCQLAMPEIERVHQTYGAKGLQVYGVNPFDKDAAKLKEWLAGRNLTYPTLLDTERLLPGKLGVTGYPLLVLADLKTKKVLYVATGYSEELSAELGAEIEKRMK